MTAHRGLTVAACVLLAGTSASAATVPEAVVLKGWPARVSGDAIAVAPDGTVTLQLTQGFALDRRVQLAPLQGKSTTGNRQTLAGLRPDGALRFLYTSDPGCGNCDFGRPKVTFTASGRVQAGANTLVDSNGVASIGSGEYLLGPNGERYRRDGRSFEVCVSGSPCWRYDPGYAPAGRDGQDVGDRVAFATNSGPVFIATTSDGNGSSGRLAVLDRATGVALASRVLTNEPSGLWPDASGGVILSEIGPRSTAVERINASGVKRWRSEFQFGSLGDPGAPVVGPTGVYVPVQGAGSASGPDRVGTLALDLDGVTRWSISDRVPTAVEPDGTLITNAFFRTIEPGLLAVSPADGRHRWSFPHRGNVAFGANGIVYLSSPEVGATFALDPSRARTPTRSTKIKLLHRVLATTDGTLAQLVFPSSASVYSLSIRPASGGSASNLFTGRLPGRGPEAGTRHFWAPVRLIGPGDGPLPRGRYVVSLTWLNYVAKGGKRTSRDQGLATAQLTIR